MNQLKDLNPQDYGLVSTLCDLLTFACFAAQRGRMYEAGRAVERASRISWKIGNGGMHSRAQTLVVAIESAILGG